MNFHDLPKQQGRHGGRTLTARQAVMLAWIVAYIAKEGRAPLITEIANAHGIRPSSTGGYLHAMHAKGVIEWSTKYRSVRPVDVRV